MLTDLDCKRIHTSLKISFNEMLPPIFSQHCVEGQFGYSLFYLKQPLSLIGSAEEIFIRSDEGAKVVILCIMLEEHITTHQQSEPVIFNRQIPIKLTSLRAL